MNICERKENDVEIPIFYLCSFFSAWLWSIPEMCNVWIAPAIVVSSAGFY